MKIVSNSREAGVTAAFLLYALFTWVMALAVHPEPTFTGAISHVVGAFLVILSLATHWTMVLVIKTARQKKGDDVAVQMALAYGGATLTYALFTSIIAGSYGRP